MAVFLKGNVITLGRGRIGGSLRDDWRPAVDQVIQELEHLNHCTERDFLAVGEQLMKFRSAARQIASDTTALNELISGDHGRNAAHALARVLEHSKEIDARIEQSGQALGEVRDLSRRIRLAFDGLRNRVSVFRILCTLTRIETSRLGSTGADFGDLGAEVRPLSEMIQSSGEGVLEASSRLDQGVRSAIRSGSDVRIAQRKDLPALIDGVTNSLKAFEERRRRAVESSAGQAIQYGSVCTAIEDLVRSVQFHDITRQQIEHVVESLRQLRSECEKRAGNADSLPSDACAVLTLQSSQLSGAAQLFASSVHDMERDLENIAVRVQEMAETTRALMGISADDQGSFFLQMENRFTAVLEMLGSCTSTQAEMASTAANLDETIGQMKLSIADIRGIEIRIQRIATNATIQSTHIGAAGDALNVIAGVMQRMALESNASTEEVAATLHAMSEAASRVSGGTDRAAAGVHSGLDQVTGEMRTTVVELHSSSECTFSRVNQIAALGAQLAGDIGAVRGGFSAGVLFAQVVTRARGELERIGAQGGKESADAKAESTQLLESHAARYTMQTERDVHDSVVRGSAIGAAAPTVASQTTAEEGDLGDNVELF